MSVSVPTLDDMPGKEAGGSQLPLLAMKAYAKSVAQLPKSQESVHSQNKALFQRDRIAPRPNFQRVLRTIFWRCSDAELKARGARRCSPA